MLVVGATGVLRPAALSLSTQGRTVIAVARNRGRLDELAALGGGRIIVVAFDVHDRTAVADALASEPLRGGVDDALVYVAGPDDEAENSAIDRVSSVVAGTTVRILTSRWTPGGASEGRSPPEMGEGRWPKGADRLHLLLGVHPHENGRWFTPDEISVAAIQTLIDGSDSLLGRPPGR